MRTEIAPDALASFHPALATWFRATLGEPTAPQRRGWPAIAAGGHVLIAAPTGTGKTLAAFCIALDGLLRQGAALEDATTVLYVSPLKALSNDVQKNLHGPLAALRELDPSLPEIRVLVRTGDTPAHERARMTKRPPHVVVTTPESLYLLLTSLGGRSILRTVRTVIVDEIHAVLGSKRGAHLALSLERLSHLAGDVQRIGLSATQKPLADVGRFLVGQDRTCTLIDAGHLRHLDLDLLLPDAPLEAVCSTDTWNEIYARIAALVADHRTTLVFVPTRKLAERAGARLGELLGKDLVRSHHGSLSKERRLEAEQRLKAGDLRALVATGSLELGIDIGDVDLVVQIGVPPSIATFLQRAGRAGHGPNRVPKARLAPLTTDELVAAMALLRAVDAGEFDRTPQPDAPRVVLAPQVVAACVHDTWNETDLLALCRRAWPYRVLDAERFESVLALLTRSDPRRALLHRDQVNGTVHATKRARLVALASAGVIPDRGEYRVVLDPEGLHIGSVDEDFAIEATVGDVFQLGNASWRVLKVAQGTLRVADAGGVPPSLPFWFGEAPARTRELSAAIDRTRASMSQPARDEPVPGERAFDAAADAQARAYLQAGRDALGAMPSRTCVVLERFFDDSGGTQLVLHAPFGARINRALGLALRKRFCRSFGFELQAAADEDSILLSLGPMHAFELEEVFTYLHPDTAENVLVQALLAAPMFEARWRWNATTSLVVERGSGGKKVPTPLQRIRAQDLLAQAFPQVLACGENLPPGDLPVPFEHPLVAQTIHDCLHEAMDVDGFLDVLRGFRDGSIEKHTVDRSSPSPFADAILAARPYAFLDDAPLEERRSRLVAPRPWDQDLEASVDLDPAAVAQVCAEAWPQPENPEELHEALCWMGFLTEGEAREGGLEEHLATLRGAGRVVLRGERCCAVEVADLDEKAIARGRLEALGPLADGDARAFPDAVMRALEADGAVLRVRLGGRSGWCERRLLARIRRLQIERRRVGVQPVSIDAYLGFLARWQRTAPGHQAEGIDGLRDVLLQLQGVEATALDWDRSLLPARVRDYKRTWLAELTMRGELAFGRLWGDGTVTPKRIPVALVPRTALPFWAGLAGQAPTPTSGDAEALLAILTTRGASFAADLQAEARLLSHQLERALADLLAQGAVTCDSFDALRMLLVPASKRRMPLPLPGRFARLRTAAGPAEQDHDAVEQLAMHLLRRWGVVTRRVLDAEPAPFSWRTLLRALRLLELRGDVRGGRFVAGLAGEQFATAAAVTMLRAERGAARPDVDGLAARDPLAAATAAVTAATRQNAPGAPPAAVPR